MPILVKKRLKIVLRALFGDYAIYYIYAGPGEPGSHAEILLEPNHSVKVVDQMMIETSEDALIRNQLCYLGAGARAYVYYLDNQIAAFCAYWYGERYRSRNFWPLKDSEAKLVQIVTTPQYRGSGVATRLIGWTGVDMMQNGFERLYARIWHSNKPSWRAFEKAGWSRIALVLEIKPWGLSKPVKLCFRVRSRGVPG